MGERVTLRIGAVAAIVGGVIALVANILHPREADILDSTEGLLTEVAGSDIWVGVHFAIAVALALLLAALYGVSRSITSESGRQWARLAWGAAVASTAIGLVLLFVDGIAVADAADTWSSASGAAKDTAFAAGSAIISLSFALFTGFIVISFGALPLLYSATLLSSDDYPAWLGWVAGLAGVLGVVAGVLQWFAGPSTLSAFVLFPIASILFTLWIIYTGFLMWQKSAAVVPAT
ncbi:MAG TPA: hypothetical protein VM848_08320 [Acidimicrobiia bacterium]|nr:hypothetical protein [Acidimicrobiia bacterium]